MDTKFMILFDTLYILSPLVGFIPQIYTGEITYDPLLSVLTIVTNIFKAFIQDESLIDTEKSLQTTVLVYQSIVCIALHIYLLNRTSKEKSITFFGKSRENSSLLRNIDKVIVTAGFILVMTVKVLKMFEMFSMISNASILFDCLIGLLHLKYYSNTDQKPWNLFLVWVIGDIIKIIVMLGRYSRSFGLIAGPVVQLTINAYILVK